MTTSVETVRVHQVFAPQWRRADISHLLESTAFSLKQSKIMTSLLWKLSLEPFRWDTALYSSLGRRGTVKNGKGTDENEWTPAVLVHECHLSLYHTFINKNLPETNDRQNAHTCIYARCYCPSATVAQSELLSLFNYLAYRFDAFQHFRSNDSAQLRSPETCICLLAQKETKQRR